MGRLIDLDKVEFLKVDGNIEFNHGVDCCINRLLKQPLVEVIPKADYENRLKADMVAMLTEMQLEIEELDTPSNGDAYMTCSELIQQKINKLKEMENEKRQQNNNTL